jgi:putative tryptophan/tyrosine transport system substrate-binding protein
MRRRDFIALVGGAAAWPVSARAQQNSPTIGYLSVRTAEGDVPMVNAVRQGLKDAGYVEGSSVSIEYRFASGQYDRLVALAEDLVRRNVAVIITGGGESAVFAAKAATSRIPIVFNIAEDPVQMGLVASLNRPGGNMTGVTSLLGALGTKQLGLIRELVPKTAVIALLVDPQVAPWVEALIAGTETAARATGQKLLVFRASSDGELEAALAAIAQQQAGALLVPASPYLYTRRERLIAFAARQALPAIYSRREHALAGGLMSYGTSTEELYGQVGLYAGRILSGVKPADLPVVQATRFELVINVRTAKTLGLEIPPTLLARADEVIE